MYTPDSFVILKILTDEPFYKVLAGWSGGYLDGDYWRINSGIESYTESDGMVDFIGASGSVYRCSVESERLTMAMSDVYNQLVDKGLAERVTYEEFKNDNNSNA